MENKYVYRFKVKKWRNIYHGTQMEGSKDSYINFKQSTLETRQIIRDKEKQYIERGIKSLSGHTNP